MNQFNVLHGDEPTNPLIDCNRQTPDIHFKYRNYPPKTSPVVLALTGRLNYHDVDIGDVEVYPSEHPLESTSDSVPDQDINMIKSNDDYERDQLLKFLHSGHDDDLLDIDLHMLQS